MRKLIFGINMTVDGCVDHTKGTGDEEIHEFFTNLMRDVDLLVYGRKTYELMVPFWPDVAKNRNAPTKAMNEFAEMFSAIDKVVFSKTLEKVEDKNTRIIHGNLKEEILKLKQQPGKNISTGGVELPEQLIELGLVDEFYFVVQPAIVGEGRRFMNGIPLQDKLELRLVESRTLKSGCVALHYVKR